MDTVTMYITTKFVSTEQLCTLRRLSLWLILVVLLQRIDNHQKFWWASDVPNHMSACEFLKCNPLIFGTWREGYNVARPPSVINPFRWMSEIAIDAGVVQEHGCSEKIRPRHRYGCGGQREGKEVQSWTTATHERMINDKKIITLPGDAPDPPTPPHKSHEQNCMKKANTSSIAQRNLFRGSLRSDRFCVRKLQGYDFN